MSDFPGRMAFAKNRSTSPILQSGMIVMMEKLSASEEGIFTVFDSARSDEAQEMAALLREEADSPADLAVLGVLRDKAVHKKVPAKLSSAKTWIAKKEGDDRVVGYISSGREFVSALGEPFGEDPSDEEEPKEEEAPSEDLEGSGIKDIPVMDIRTPEGLRLVERGTLKTIDGQLSVTAQRGRGRFRPGVSRRTRPSPASTSSRSPSPPATSLPSWRARSCCPRLPA